MNKPYAESCDQNRLVIEEVVAPLFKQSQSVLEIGSGTGQHAVYFAAQYPELVWQTSDRLPNHSGIQQWIDDSHLPNVLPPLNLDVCHDWPENSYDLVFSANTLHIMSIEEVACFFSPYRKSINRDLYSGHLRPF